MGETPFLQHNTHWPAISWLDFPGASTGEETSEANKNRLAMIRKSKERPSNYLQQAAAASKTNSAFVWHVKAPL